MLPTNRPQKFSSVSWERAWKGIISNLDEARALPCLRHKRLLHVKVQYSSHVSLSKAREKRTALPYPFEQEGYGGFTWPVDISPETILITEEFRCGGGRCTSIGTKKYPRCEVCYKVLHYSTHVEVWVKGSHGVGVVEEENPSTPSRGLTTEVNMA
jgi:hypothetical protein